MLANPNWSSKTSDTLKINRNRRDISDLTRLKFTAARPSLIKTHMSNVIIGPIQLLGMQVSEKIWRPHKIEVLKSIKYGVSILNYHIVEKYISLAYKFKCGYGSQKIIPTSLDREGISVASAINLVNLVNLVLYGQSLRVTTWTKITRKMAAWDWIKSHVWAEKVYAGALKLPCVYFLNFI